MGESQSRSFQQAGWLMWRSQGNARICNADLPLIAGAVAVLLAYVLPFLMNSAGRAPFLNVAVHDEKVYLARVVDAYRGGSLGNPYLAEHQNAVRFMPELAERVLAPAAHASGLQPLLVVGISRFVLPVLIYLFLWSLAGRCWLQCCAPSCLPFPGWQALVTRQLFCATFAR